MSLYENIVLQLQKSRKAQQTPNVIFSAPNSGNAAAADDESPTIDEILIDLERNIDGTSEIFQEIESYLPALEPSLTANLRRTPRIEPIQASVSPIVYPNDEALSGSVVWMPANSKCEGTVCKPSTAELALKPSETGKNDDFSQELSEALYTVREQSRLVSYIKQKDEPAPKPLIEQALQAETETSLLQRESAELLREIDRSQQQLRQEMQAGKQTTVIIPPSHVSSPVRTQKQRTSISCIITPCAAKKKPVRQVQSPARFEVDTHPIDMSEVVEAARALLLSADAMFEDVKKLNSDRLRIINEKYAEVVRQPRMTRLMWKFFCEQNIAFRVEQFDAVMLYNRMVNILLPKFGQYGGPLADFLSCQLELDYDIIGICVLVMFSRH